jgi:hypothetical protein
MCLNRGSLWRCSLQVRYVASVVYTVMSAGVVAFQVALAAGAPWGSFAMGGAFPGQFTPPLRVAAFVQAVLVILMAVVVLSRAGFVLPSWSRLASKLVWAVVALAAISSVLDLITPSAGERTAWDQ